MSVESLVPPAALSDEQFLHLVNGVINHEAKLLTGAIICARPDEWIKRTALRSAVISCQGKEPAWAVSKVLPTNYCDQSLGPSGVVTIGTVEGQGGQVKAARATEFGARWLLAFAGGTLEWGLEYPDASVQAAWCHQFAWFGQGPRKAAGYFYRTG